MKKISEKFESIDNLNSTFEKSHIFEQNFGSNSNRLVENLVENSNEFDNLCDSFSDYLVGKESTYFVSNLEEYKSNVDSLREEVWGLGKFLIWRFHAKRFLDKFEKWRFLGKLVYQGFYVHEYFGLLFIEEIVLKN